MGQTVAFANSDADIAGQGGDSSARSEVRISLQAEAFEDAPRFLMLNDPMIQRFSTHCPFCEQVTNAIWKPLPVLGVGDIGIAASICPNCGKAAIWNGAELTYPKVLGDRRVSECT